MGCWLRWSWGALAAVYYYSVGFSGGVVVLKYFFLFFFIFFLVFFIFLFFIFGSGEDEVWCVGSFYFLFFILGGDEGVMCWVEL